MGLSDTALDDLHGALSACAADVAASGLLPFPDPWGCPAPGCAVSALRPAALGGPGWWPARDETEVLAQRPRGHHLPRVAPGLGVVTEPGRHFAGHLGGAWDVARPHQHLVHARRPHGLGERQPRSDREGPDALRRELHVAHVGDAVERRLGGRVGNAPPPGTRRRRGRREGGLGEHVDQAALAALEHLGQQELGQEERVEVVADQAALGQLEGEVEDPVHRAGPLVDGVVHQHVDPAELRQRHRGDTLDRRAVHQVHGHGQTGSAQCLDLRRGGVQAAGDRQRVVVAQRARQEGRGHRPRAPCGP